MLLCSTITLNAQFEDDMEYPNGIPASSYWWPTCSGCTPIIVGPNAGENSDYTGYIDGSGMDPLLLLGDKIFGSWGLKFSMYIPSGKIGYWNIQGSEAPGLQWIVGNITFGNGIISDDEMTGRIDWNTIDESDDTLFQFPKDQWFHVIMNFDFNSGASVSTWTMWVDGVEVVAPETPFADKSDPPVYAQALGGINMFSVSSQMEMYVDNFNYINGFFDPPLSVEDFNAKEFKIYPNPSDNVIKITSEYSFSEVKIYSINGKLLKTSLSSEQIDISNLSTGIYFVEAISEKGKSVQKLIKN